MTTPETCRIPNVPREAWTDEIREVFAVYEGEDGRQNGSKFNVIQMFAQHPKLTQAWLTYNRILSTGVLPIRLHELAVLRVLDRNKSDYEWPNHVQIAKRAAGFTDAMIEAVKQGPDAAVWTDLDRRVLRAADQLCDTGDLDQPTWDGLAKDLSHPQILELLFTVGSYTMLSWIFKATRLQPEGMGA
jgi:4-carboxymuconolactone decarboxylase